MNGMFPKPSSDDIPYLSIGAERYRGNGSALGYMNLAGSKHCVKFTTKLWDFKLPSPVGSQPAVLAYYLLLKTSWGGMPRGLFITLAHWNIQNSSATTFVKKAKWNWPIQESFYHKGSEFAYMDAEDVNSLCGFSVPLLTTIGQEISYDLDIQALFRCASNLGGYSASMPYGYLPIEGVHWAVEMTGDNGWLWPSVHDMEMSY
jgi:hypothetical protein